MAVDRRSGWRQTTLGALGRIVTGKTPPTRDATNFGGHIPFITPSDMDGRRVIHRTARLLTDAGVAAVRNARIPAGAVLVSCIGSGMGKAAIGAPDSVTNQQINSLIVQSGDVSLYVYYDLSARKAEIQAKASGSAQPILNKSAFGRLPINLPPVRDQQAIAKVLGALDEKIDVNRRTNETLSGLARAQFKTWFVDFDPIRAKSHDHVPLGFDVEGARALASSMRDDVLGQMPSNWRVATVGDVAEVIDCLHSKKPQAQPDGEPLLQLENIRADGLLDLSKIYHISPEDYALWVSRFEAHEGDCVITNVGRVGAVGQVPAGFRAALGRNMTGIRTKPSFPFPTFLIECLLSAPMHEEIERKTDAGTILEALNVRSIPSLRFARPPDDLLSRFESRVRPIRARMELNERESLTLAELRDALLPRLLSGEMRVHDAEREVAAAV